MNVVNASRAKPESRRGQSMGSREIRLVVTSFANSEQLVGFPGDNAAG
jgi:hypothetical protein